MDALILVDIQNDFMPTGALPVPHADEIIPVANHVQKNFDLIVATQDWHPSDHKSFADQHPGTEPGQLIDLAGLQQILWPRHCVQHTRGAEFVSTLDVSRVKTVIQKGIDKEIDSYSGFFDNGHRRATGLYDYLIDQQVKEVYLLGVATDYCVKYTALDACKLGFKTYLISDGCRGVNLNSNDVTHAIEAMKKAGVRLVGSEACIFKKAH